MDIKFLDFEAFKLAIEKLLLLISGKADKSHKHTTIDVATDDANQFISIDEKAKLGNIDNYANNYTHPTTHSASMIVESTDKQFTSGIEKAKWNAKPTIEYVDGKYNAVLGSVPISLNTLEKISSAINNDPNFDENMNTRFGNKVDKVAGMGLSTNDYTSFDKTKLAGIATNANNYVHPATHSADIIVETTNKRFVSDTEKITWNGKATTEYVDSKVGEMTGLAPETLNSLGKLANAIGNDPDFVNTITSDINNKADKSYVDGKVASIVNSAPETLDTLNELSDALGNDPNFATSIVNQIGTKVDKIAGMGLSENSFTNSEKTKLYGIDDGANNYSHPLTHDASMIVENNDKMFTNAIDKAKVDKITIGGDGTKYLADDGTYKVVVSGGNASIDDTNPLSTTTTYSASKVESRLDTKAESNHTHASLHSHPNMTVINSIVNNGDGSKYLADDGTYKTVSTSGSSVTFSTTEEITTMINSIF